MNIEQEVFKRVHPEPELLLKYGFEKNDDSYIYHTDFMEHFYVEITVSDESVKGKIVDKDFDEEYTNYRMEGKLGAFASTVREEYILLLENICVECFRKNYFIYPQSNRLAQYCIDTYKTKPEFPFENDPSAVVRHKNNKKWYGVIMNINRKKLDQVDEDVEILNVKVETNMIEELIKTSGIYKCYHMNKKYWISIILNDTLDDAIIESLIDMSFNLTKH